MRLGSVLHFNLTVNIVDYLEKIMGRIILTDGNQICSTTSCHVTRLRTVDMQYSRKQSYIETRKDWLQENCSV